MNSWSSADSGPLSSMPAGSPARSARRLEAHGAAAGAGRLSKSISKPPGAGLPAARAASGASSGAARCAARAAPASRGSRRPGRGRPPRGTPRPSRVGLRHQRVVARLAVELDQLAPGCGCARGCAGRSAGGARRRGRSGGARRACPRPAGAARRPRRSGPRRGTPARAAGARPRPRGRAASRRLEDRAGVVRPLRAEAGLREPQRHLAVGGGGPPRLLEVLDRAGEVLLDEVDAGRGREQARAARPRAQGLLDELERLGEVALLDQLLGDGHVLVRRLLQVAVARVELRQADADLHVRGVDLGHPPQDVARLADLVALDVLVDRRGRRSAWPPPPGPAGRRGPRGSRCPRASDGSLRRTFFQTAIAFR